MIIATILLTIPLTTRAIFDMIKLIFPSFMVAVDDNYNANASYNLIFFMLTTYLPVVCQITSLVFGFVRHKQGKFFGRRGGGDRNINRSPGDPRREDEDDEMYEDDMTDLNVTDNGMGYFDPPIENYRFYYQGENNEGR